MEKDDRKPEDLPETPSHFGVSPLRQRRLAMVARRRFLKGSAKVAGAATVAYSAPKISVVHAGPFGLSPTGRTIGGAFTSVAYLGSYGGATCDSALANLDLTTEQITSINNAKAQCVALANDSTAVVQDYNALSDTFKSTCDMAAGQVALSAIETDVSVIMNGDGDILDAAGQNTGTHVNDGVTDVKEDADNGTTSATDTLNNIAEGMDDFGDVMVGVGGAVTIVSAALGAEIVAAGMAAKAVATVIKEVTSLCR